MAAPARPYRLDPRLGGPIDPGRAEAPERPDSWSLGGLQLPSEGEKIFLSERGAESELQLSVSPQRDHMLRLLHDYGAAGVRLDPDPRLIMSGGGGSGFSLRDLKTPLTSEPLPAPRDPPPTAARSGLDGHEHAAPIAPGRVPVMPLDDQQSCR